MEDTKLLLTVPQAADRLGVGRSLLYEMIRRGEVQSIRLGRARRIPVSALERFVRERLEAEAGDGGTLEARQEPA